MATESVPDSFDGLSRLYLRYGGEVPRSTADALLAGTASMFDVWAEIGGLRRDARWLHLYSDALRPLRRDVEAISRDFWRSIRAVADAENLPFSVVPGQQRLFDPDDT